eukprot:6256532-Ditylum_brightwellii.AAC.1
MQAPKKGGITWAFDENNAGLFPENVQHLTYAELAPGMTEDGMDPYWKTDQLIEHFNDHYRRHFEHGWKNQPGVGHKCECKPQGFGPEYKCMSAVGINVTTTLEH